MKRITISTLIAAFAILALVATVVAASPTPSPSPMPERGQGLISSILKLTTDQLMDLRHEGLSLAQIAARQGVDPQKLIDALESRWTTRIEARVESGAMTTTEAATLKAEVAERAKAMVEQTAIGGMRGSAVGAGPEANGAGTGAANRPGNGAGNGAGMGAGGMGARRAGTCDGTGPNGRTAP